MVGWEGTGISQTGEQPQDAPATSTGPVALYGIIEIARAIEEDRRKVAVWHSRGKLPPADFHASGRPFWKPPTIEPWIRDYRHAKAEAAAHRAASSNPDQPSSVN